MIGGVLTRREWIGGGLAASALAAPLPVRHLLPTATHDRFLIKASYHQPQRGAPELHVGNRRVTGQRTDTAGRFWLFDVPNLQPSTTYSLRLNGSEPWPLRTFPAPDAPVASFRLLVYTCAGGHDAMTIEDTGAPYWVPVPARRRLLQRALREQPDAVIAIGDHVYWDLRYGRGTGKLPIGQQPWAKAIMGGEFNRSLPVQGTPNETILQNAVDRQIAELYGTLLRSTPVHFIQDDHDYFENDEAIETGISFPPDDFMTRLARATQHLYFPEHLPDANRPSGLPGSSAAGRPPGVSECFGTLRIGTLAELLLYDCRRFQTLRGPHATLIPENVEEWIAGRLRAPGPRHVVNVPSMPIGWSAGKWGEWYPDVLDGQGRLGTSQPKYFWQSGWRSQHDRLLQAASQSGRLPVFLSGDLHALAHGSITRNGRMDLRANPVHSILTGPLSTGPRGWPSSARGTPPLLATGLEAAQTLAPSEQNGFTILDFTPGQIAVRMYAWKMDRPESDIDALGPVHQFTLSN